jgi:hypothetical protein
MAMVQEEAFWNHDFLLHHNVRAMYNAWEVWHWWQRKPKCSYNYNI